MILVKDNRFTAAPNGEAEFKGPRHYKNDGRGESRFVKHSTPRTRQYIKDHIVYIKILVDP